MGGSYGRLLWVVIKEEEIIMHRERRVITIKGDSDLRAQLREWQTDHKQAIRAALRERARDKVLFDARETIRDMQQLRLDMDIFASTARIASWGIIRQSFWTILRRTQPHDYENPEEIKLIWTTLVEALNTENREIYNLREGVDLYGERLKIQLPRKMKAPSTELLRLLHALQF